MKVQIRNGPSPEGPLLFGLDYLPYNPAHMERETALFKPVQVTHIDALQLATSNCLRWCCVFGGDSGADALALFYFESESGETDYLSFGDSEVVLYLIEGQACIEISDHRLDAVAGCGVHVRRNESFRFSTGPGPRAAWLAAACPQAERFEYSHRASGTFDQDHPVRVVDGALSEQHATSDRYYKLLVGSSIGSKSITQFVGRIPKSKAPEHYHLYEEVICILSGEGRMWAGDQRTDVGPGSLIFLPREQRHSLECTSAEGMELVGMFYPAGSPAINYET